MYKREKKLLMKTTSNISNIVDTGVALLLWAPVDVIEYIETGDWPIVARLGVTIIMMLIVFSTAAVFNNEVKMLKASLWNRKDPVKDLEEVYRTFTYDSMSYSVISITISKETFFRFICIFLNIGVSIALSLIAS